MSFDNKLHPLAPLKLSLDMAIINMNAKNTKAVELFCMIGLMPGGVIKNDLKELWGQDWLMLLTELTASKLVQ